jgi:cyclophilin family peptidyl-prolyl cis-trans isomerase
MVISSAFILANPIAKMSVEIEYPESTITGDIIIELYENEAPNTVKNFVQYVRDEFYDNTIFHRVVDGFIVQGGGLTEDHKRKATRRPIANEAHNKVQHARGTIGMARTSDIHSATSQFFFNLGHNPELNYKNSTRSGYGHVVFGKVFQGLELVDKISTVPTYVEGYHRHIPAYQVRVKKVELIRETPLTEKVKETQFASTRAY